MSKLLCMRTRTHLCEHGSCRSIHLCMLHRSVFPNLIFGDIVEKIPLVGEGARVFETLPHPLPNNLPKLTASYTLGSLSSLEGEHIILSLEMTLHLMMVMLDNGGGGDGV